MVLRQQAQGRQLSTKTASPLHVRHQHPHSQFDSTPVQQVHIADAVSATYDASLKLVVLEHGL